MNLKKLWTLVLFSAFAFTSALAQEKYSKVKIPITSAEIKKFVAENLDLDHFKYEGKAMVVVLNSEELNRLKQSHYPFEMVVDDMVQHTIEVNKNTTPADIVNRAVIQGNGCQKIATIIPTPAAFGNGGSLRLGAAAGNPGYYTYAEMVTQMQNLATANPGLVSLINIGNSAAGTAIYGVKISDNVAVDENEPEVLFTGLQHAREAIGGTSLVFFMQYLAANYNNADHKIKDLVDNREIYIIPCLNPDGYAFNYGGSSGSYPVTGGGLWRKNRRNTGGGASNIGVDLNRNYSIDWGNCSGASSSCGSNVKTDDTYYGTSAFSEPETQALRDFVYTRHFVNAIDQHCFGPYYSLPYGRPSLHPVLNHVDSSYYKYVPALMGLYNGHRAGNSPETVNYEVAGGIKDWLLMGDIGVGTGPKGKVYGMTGEAGGGDFWAPVAQIPQLCKENCFQNLQLAYAAGDYYDVNDRKDIAVTSLTGKFSFDIRRVGLGSGPVTVSLIPILNIQSVGAPITTTLSTYYDTYIDSISYTLPITAGCGKKIQYAWKVESGNIATYDTVTKYYNPVTLLSDDMEGSFATNWTATISPTGPAGWAFTTLAAVSGTHSMTESPSGNYTTSSTRTVTYKNTFNLSDATESYLSFWVKHRAENFHDKLQVQVSTNGTTWFPMCGTTTVTEDNTTSEGFLNGQPALTGIRDNWTRELFDMSAYAGNASVSLRFQFTSDNDATAFAFELDDGFYIDDIKAIKITAAVPAAPAAPTASNATICTGNTASLSATGTAILGWYSAANGGTYLGGGSSFTTPVLTSTATYYVQDSLCLPSTRKAVLVTVNQNSTINLSSAAGTASQTLCNNNAITPITYTIGGGGTGASITAGALPAGVTGTYGAGMFTISGTPTASGTFNYTVTTTGPCTNASLSGSITVIANATVTLTSAAGTDAQTVCINNAITNIRYAIGGSGTGASVTAGSLPAGVTASYSAGVFTISGTATTSGTFNYTVSSSGSSCVNSMSGTITVRTNSAISLSSAAGTNNQTICIQNGITNITYAIGGSATGATITGTLPAGVTGSYNTGVFTISGFGGEAGTFNYTITTTGPCVNNSLSGTITVIANGTINAQTQVNPVVCINQAMPNIVFSVGGSATGATVSGSLPTGVTGSYNAGVFTISGTPTQSGTFFYNVTTTGPCVSQSQGGMIDVRAGSSITLTSAAGTDAQTVCINNAVTNIIYTIGGTANSAFISGGQLPLGVTGTANANGFTISGTPTSAGTFFYTITASGPCGLVSLNGSITVNPNALVTLNSAPATASQTVCINNVITNISYLIGNGATGVSITAGALPAGVTGSFAGNIFTISGTPTVSGVFNYTVTTSGGPCANASLNGSITVIANSSISLTSLEGTNTQTICIQNSIANITYAIGGSATGATLTGTLPSGVTGSYNAGVFTISGFGGEAGVFNYTVTTTGPCLNNTLSGTITVTANGTLNSSSNPNQVLCVNSQMQDINFTVGGSATGATLSGSLPAGVTGSYNAGLGIYTVSGTPTQSGTFSFSVTTTGPCISQSQGGTIDVVAGSTITLTSAPGTDGQTVCANNPIINITYSYGGTANSIFLTGGQLPPGVTGTTGPGGFTISGTPTASGFFSYTVSSSGSCGFASLSGNIFVNPNSSISLISAPATTSQNLCINNAITNIAYVVGNGAAGASITAGSLPAGVTGSFAGNIFTISGTPTVSGVFNYTVTTSGGPCANASLSGTITVNANSTIALSSSAGTNNQTICIQNSITNITYAIGGTATSAFISAGSLPVGVTGSYNAGVFTISGTPTTAGIFTYTVSATGPCSVVSLSGSIEVNATTGINLTSAEATTSQTVCINTAITDITYAASNATAASITAGSLPAGVTGSFSAGVFTISGTPTAAGVYNYTVTATGICNSTSLSGSITVNPNSTIVLTSGTSTDNQVICSNTAITTVTYAIGGGATGASLTGSLPAGVTGSYNAGVFTISGTPSVSGSYNYTITTTGACANPSVTGSITINMNGTIALNSATGTNAQVVCNNSAITNISYAVGGAGSGSIVNGLPPGVSGSFSSGLFTISGTPTTAGVYNYTVTTTGGSCSQGTATGTITVNAVVLNTTINNVSACGNGNDGSIIITPSGGTSAYTYSWTGSNGYTAGNTPTITNLGFGYYNVFVTDVIGCTATATNMHIGNAFVVYVTASGTMSGSCAPTGSISLYGNAGVPPYAYSLDGINYQPGNTFSNLAAGNYTGYIKDAAGCVGTKSVTVTAAQPIVVTVVSRSASACVNDGSLEIYRSGGIAPYMYSMDGLTFQVGNIFSNLGGGTYTVYVKDAAGCVTSKQATVTQAAAISITLGKINSSACVNDGSIQVNASGGTAPYTYSLNAVNFQSGNTFSALGGGNYTVTVKDAKGCTRSASVTLSVNTIVVTASVVNASNCLTSNGSIQLFRTGGTGPYTYSLDNITYQTSPLFSSRAHGSYTGYVKDSKGCIGVLSNITVGPVNCPPEFANNTNVKINPAKAATKISLTVQAYPNPSTTEFTLAVSGYDGKEKIAVNVTDVLGRKVYSSEFVPASEYKIGKELKTGIYLVEVIQGNNKQSIRIVKE